MKIFRVEYLVVLSINIPGVNLVEQSKSSSLASDDPARGRHNLLPLFLKVIETLMMG
jgi:hypothetical protein